jgi:hypothetical protein
MLPKYDQIRHRYPHEYGQLAIALKGFPGLAAWPPVIATIQLKLSLHFLPRHLSAHTFFLGIVHACLHIAPPDPK